MFTNTKLMMCACRNQLRYQFMTEDAMTIQRNPVMGGIISILQGEARYNPKPPVLLDGSYMPLVVNFRLGKSKRCLLMTSMTGAVFDVCDMQVTIMMLSDVIMSP